MKHRKRRSPGALFGLAMGALIGGGAMFGFGLLLGKAGKRLIGPLHDVPFWGVLLSIVVVCFLTLALHELGHLLAGLHVGFRPYLYVVGPLRIEWNVGERIRVQLNRNAGLSGGACVCLPADTQDLPRRFAITLLGGPLMSLLVGVFGLALALLPTGAPVVVRMQVGLLGTISSLIALVTAIPMPNGAFLTDGARWLRLRRGGLLAERDAALLQMYALTLTGIPTREWPETTLHSALAVEDGSIFEAGAHYFAYLCRLDRREIIQAGTHLDQALEIMEPMNAGLQAAYRLEAAWFAAWHRGDVATAQAFLACVGKGSVGVSEVDFLRVRAAIALRSGEAEEGHALLQQAEKALPAGPTSQWVRENLKEMGLSSGQATKHDGLQMI